MENLSEDDLAKTANSSHSQDIASFYDYNVAVIIWKVWAPCILLLGSFGNIAIILVMRRIKDHNSSQYAILMALAVSDLCLLYVGVLREWVRHMFHVDLRNWHTVFCKLHKWMTYCFNTTSAWLVTYVTVQRTMAVLWPHRVRIVCTVRRTRIVIAAVYLTAFSLYSHLVPGLDIRQSRCAARPGVYEYFYRHIFTWTDLCVSSVLPSFCLFICDVILSLELFKATSISSMAVHAISNVSATHSESRRKKASKTTVMILTLSCTFFVLTLPVFVFYIFWYMDENVHMMQPPRVIANLKLVSTVTHLLWYSNSAINFLLYCLTGTKYRSEFFHLIRCSANSDVSAGETSAGSFGGGRNTHCDSKQLSTLS